MNYQYTNLFIANAFMFKFKPILTTQEEKAAHSLLLNQ
jgi:hypothetical protein